MPGTARLAFSVFSVQVFPPPGNPGRRARPDLLRFPGRPVFSHQSQDLRITDGEGAMSATRTEFAAVSYHASLANDWEHRYQKRSFQVRQNVLLKSLQGRDLAGTLWLDAGCGTGTLARWLAGRGCGVLGVDAAPEMVAAANQSLEFESHSDRLSFVRVSTLARLALDDGSLDGILCSSVLEYLPDPRACLTEFARV